MRLLSHYCYCAGIVSFPHGASKFPPALGSTILEYRTRVPVLSKGYEQKRFRWGIVTTDATVMPSSRTLVVIEALRERRYEEPQIRGSTEARTRGYARIIVIFSY